MTNIFLDANIWLRLFLQDQQVQYQSVVELFTNINNGYLRPYTSTIVLLEINYVLRSFYKLTHEKTLFYLEKTRQTRNITIIETTDSDKALSYYKKYKVKFSDCLIASQLQKNILLLTFDNEFKKIKEVHPQTPQKFLAGKGL